MRKLTAKQEAKRLDSAIAEIYHRRCSGIQIMLFDIPKVYAAAKLANTNGQDMEAAIVAFVDSIRKN